MIKDIYCINSEDSFEYSYLRSSLSSFVSLFRYIFSCDKHDRFLFFYDQRMSGFILFSWKTRTKKFDVSHESIKI